MVDLGLNNKIISEKQAKKICTVKKFFWPIFRLLLFFTVYDFLNFDFQLDYCSLNKKKHFHKKNHPYNFIFLASRELFFFFFIFMCTFLGWNNPIFCDKYDQTWPNLEAKENFQSIFFLFLVLIIYLAIFSQKLIFV